MEDKRVPELFLQLINEKIIESSDITETKDGFYLVYKPLSYIMLEKGIADFLGSSGERLLCCNFFDDWFLYAIADGDKYIYSLLKFREQEHDAEMGIIADGDTPGVTISFISFNYGILLDCLMDSKDENRQKLDAEINRVVAYKRQCHNKVLKNYFKNPESEASYLVASMYTKHIASFAEDGCLEVPEHYKKIAKQSISNTVSAKHMRLPDFIKSINDKAGYAVCDNEKIYIKDKENPDEYERAVILAAYAGNVSVYSFAAEVEWHAKFLFSLAKIKIPFLGKSVYESAIRADMTVGDTEFEGPAPYYNENSKIVKRQYKLHCNTCFDIGVDKK